MNSKNQEIETVVIVSFTSTLGTTLHDRKCLASYLSRSEKKGIIKKYNAHTFFIRGYNLKAVLAELKNRNMQYLILQRLV